MKIPASTLMARPTFSVLLGFSLACFALAPGRAAADANDPSSRVARIAYTRGSVSLSPAGTQDWVAAPLNRPLTIGDTVWSDQDSRVELQLGASVIRLASSSELSFVNLGNEVTQLQLTSGTLLLRVRRLNDDETYEVDTPNLAFSVLRPGLYRISVDPAGNTTSVSARNGQGEVTGGGSAYTLHAGDSEVFSGTDQLSVNSQPDAFDQDPFDTWAADRDSHWDRSVSVRYVSADVVGSEDLDEHGAWRRTADYGYVWYPRGVGPGWAPYHAGHWSYIAPWGYTWVDDQPWGFAPFHYGRWVRDEGEWCWVPAPPRPEGGEYSRPVYAPALVAWVGAGAAIAWFALGPREVYVPSYPVSANYVRNINVTNTTVNTTVINNVYNTTIVNNTTVNETYVNRAVPGAITATSAHAFATAQSVARNPLKVDQRALAGAQVRALAPAVVPTKQAVLGSSPQVPAKPPTAVQTRSVVARTPPPPPPVTFERRQEALKSNAGKPLSLAQVRQIQPATAPPTVAVRVAPAALPVNIARPAVPLEAPKLERPAARMPPAPPRPAPVPVPPRPAPVPAVPAAIHPRELPAMPQPASPSIASSALEREHLQQQQALRAQQDQERQRVQQQQELAHQRLAQEQAAAAKTQELERQHAQQTQQLQQKHVQEQSQLEARQQEQRRAAVPPANPPEKRRPP